MNENKKKWLKLSLWTFVIGACILLFSYFFFHYVTDTGIILIKQEEAGKPFVTFLIASFGVLQVCCSVVSLLVAFIFYGDKKKEENV